MKTVLIPLNLKDTEVLEWSKLLALYLKRNYGSDQWSHFFDPDKVKELDHLRTNANNKLSNKSLLDQNMRYYAYLEHLYLRMGNQSDQLGVDFIWYDAEYDTHGSKKYKQRTLVFEKSSILYNIATLLTRIAQEKMNDNTNESITCLSKAAMCFKYMGESFLNSPSIDLQTDTINFLSDLCHAEAQELFLLKLINAPNSSKRCSLISKLSCCTFNLYEKCTVFYEREHVESILYGNSEWETIIKCKVYIYKSMAAYNYSLYLEQSNRIGEAIAFAQLSSNLITSALSYISNSKIEIDLDNMSVSIDNTLKTLLKDNNFIYHEQVPADVNLETIKSIDAIKVISWEEQLMPYMTQIHESANDIFGGIIPVEVYEKESIYSEEKAKLLRKELENVETANLEYQSFIEFTDILTVIRTMEKHYLKGENINGDPHVMVMKKQLIIWSEIVYKSGLSGIDYEMERIIEKRKEISEILKEISPDQKDNIVKIKASLVQASQSDDKLFSLVRPYTEEINLLKDVKKLCEIFDGFNLQNKEPSLLDIDDSKNNKIKAKIVCVNELYESLVLLKQERIRTLEELKINVSDDDLTKVLILNINKPESEIKKLFQAELDKFKPLINRIEATIFKQKSTMNEIKIVLDDLFKLSEFHNKSPEQEANEKQRKDLYDKLEKAITSFIIFADELPKGLNFYESLLSTTKALSSKATSNSETGLSYKDIPPPLPPCLDDITSCKEKLENFKISSGNLPTVGFSNSTIISQHPSTVYSAIDTFPTSLSSSFSNEISPNLPDRLPNNFNQLMHQQINNQSDYGQNPTSFYDNPSVFNENLYSKFSK